MKIYLILDLEIDVKLRVGFVFAFSIFSIYPVTIYCTITGLTFMTKCLTDEFMG